MSGIASNPLEANTGSAQSHANAVSASSGPSAREAVARPSNDLSDDTDSEHRVDQGPTWKAYDPQKVNNYLLGGPIANDRGASTSIAATDAPRSDVTSALAPATLDGDQDGTRNAQATIPSPPSTSDLPPAASTPPTASTPFLERARYVAALSSPQATNHAQQLIAARQSEQQHGAGFQQQQQQQATAVHSTHPQNPEQRQSHSGTRPKTQQQPAQIPTPSLSQAEASTTTRSVQKHRHDTVQQQAVQQSEQQRPEEAQPANGSNSATGTTHSRENAQRQPRNQQPGPLGTSLSRHIASRNQIPSMPPAVDTSGARPLMPQQLSRNSVGRMEDTPVVASPQGRPHGSPHIRNLVTSGVTPSIENLDPLVQDLVQKSQFSFERLFGKMM